MSDATRNVIIVLLVAFAALGGFLYYTMWGGEERASGGADRGGGTPGGRTATPQVEQALAGEGELRCSFTDDATGGHVDALIRHGDIRLEGETARGEEYIELFRSGMIYAWLEDSSEGYELAASKVETLGPNISDIPIRDRAQVISEIRQHDQTCTLAQFAQSDFRPPLNVSFVDYEALYQQQLRQSGEGKIEAEQRLLQ